MKRMILWSLVVLALLAVVPVWAGGDKQGQAASVAPAAPVSIPLGQSVSQNTDITAAVVVDFTTMDPQDTSDTLSGGIQRLMMDGLFGFDDNMKVINLLAESYTANENATEFTFVLKKGISFTDGVPWDADAFIANLKKWDDKSLRLKRTSLLADVIDTWEKIDSHQVKIKLTGPFGALIPTLAHQACVIMSPRQIAAGVNACAEKPVGTGQYEFVEWVRGDHLTIRLKKDWWGYDPARTGGKPLAEKDAGFKSITFKPVPESATRTAMVQSGDAQIMWTVPPESVRVLQRDSSLTVGIRRSLVAYYLWMNTQKKPFSDKRVRQALNYALDRNALIAVVENGIGSVPNAIIGPDTQFAKELPPIPYDVAKAKQLLAEAGYPNGFSTTIMGPNTTVNTKTLEFFQQQYAPLGITIQNKLMESAVTNERVQDVTGPGSEVEVEMYLSGWSSSTGDADWAIRPLFATESAPPLNYNLAYFSNAKLDALIRQGLSSADNEVRRKAYSEAQDLLWEELPVVPRHIANIAWVTSRKIINITNFPDGSINLRAGRMAP
ncbi:MAG: ABC transporter substrate-binding protein [Treponema sp.]|jgi:glutathione transport system substrate-binding protein|nr:ABC transporter substrate-binding protein [Treponema sp.]